MGAKNMYLLYVDESGTADPIVTSTTNGCTQKFVIGGILVNSNDSQQLEESFYYLKEKYLKFPLKELKYNTKAENIKKGFNKEKLREETFDFISNSSCNFKIVSIIFDKSKISQKPYLKNTKEEIYSKSFQFLLERINLELRDSEESCLVILDSRNRSDNKILYKSYMDVLKNGTNIQGADKFNHFLPSIAFSDSEFCLNLCIADFCCAAVFQWAEFNRPRYLKIIKNKFRQKNGRIKGFGISCFP